MNSLRGVVKVLGGVLFTKKGKPIETFQGALSAEAECGCGIDCCHGALVLKDQETKELTYVYVSGGELMTTTNRDDLVQV